MIAGLGMDLIEVARMQQVLERHGPRFLCHVFTPEEQNDAPRGEGRVRYYAGRWAAKEAVAKSLGTGIGARCRWTDIRVRRGEAGEPVVTLAGRALETAQQKNVIRILVSITHERSVAGASAVAESRRATA